MRKTLATLATAFVASSAFATSFDPVSVEKLVQASDVVVTGKIVHGRTLPSNCGVEVTIKVDVPIKGHYLQGDLISTSIFVEQADIGSDRVFFISRTKDQISGMASTNSHDMKLMHDRWLRCKDIYPSYAVNLTGMAAPPIVGTYLDDAKRAVSLNDFVIIPPPELQSHKEDRSKGHTFDGSVDHIWIEQSKFVDYLKSLVPAR